MSIQERNPELVDLLTPDFQGRYEPNFACGNIVSTFSMIPGLRGLWPMSAVGDSVSGTNSLVTDLSGQGRHLTNNGVALGSYAGLAPFYNFDGTNDWLSRTDENGLDILGTEGYITSSYRGLTLGGWYYFSALAPGNSKGIIGKYLTTGNQRAYLVSLPAGTNTPQFTVSVDGTATVSIASTYTMVVTTWYFIVARFSPSSEISITVNGTANEDILAVGIPASIFNSNADLNIFAFDNGAATTRNAGYASVSFLSAAYLSDAIINNLFNQSKALFGVH